MKIVSLMHRLLASVRFHVERLGLSRGYPKRISQASFGKGNLVFEVNNLTEANRIRYFDGEKVILMDLLERLQEDDVFFDVGACLGLYSLHCALRCRHVVAFEPEPGFRHHLERNIEINELSNVVVLPYAISDRSTMLTLFTDGTDGKSPSLNNADFKNKVEVQARTLSDLVSLCEVPAPTILKMDIEGAEILALRGMTELMLKNPPRCIFLEMHPALLEQFGSSSAEVLSLLANARYQIAYQGERDGQVHCIFEFIADKS